MEWICAADEKPLHNDTYFVIDLRTNRKRIIHYNKDSGTSLINRLPHQMLWAKFTVEENNYRIMKECQQSAKNRGGVYVFSTEHIKLNQ